MKKHEKFMVFRGNIVSSITGDTSSDQGMLFGTFLTKNIFIKFSTPILNHVFAQFHWNFHDFLKQTWWLCANTSWQCRQNLWKPLDFWWNRAKNMIQNKSWKIDENIFHKKCPKQHSLITESVAGDVRVDITPKNHEFFMRFHVFWLL